MFSSKHLTNGNELQPDIRGVSIPQNINKKQKSFRNSIMVVFYLYKIQPSVNVMGNGIGPFSNMYLAKRYSFIHKAY